MRLKEAMLAEDYISHAFRFISDGGHAWLRVPHKVIADVELSPKSFSRYSYIDHEYMYLEEDCDAGVFITAYLAKYKHEPAFSHVATERAHIREKRRNVGGYP